MDSLIHTMTIRGTERRTIAVPNASAEVHLLSPSISGFRFRITEYASPDAAYPWYGGSVK
jgi:hypothetical protein